MSEETRPQPSFKDALGSFVDQSKYVAEAQRRTRETIARLETVENHVKELKRLLREKAELYRGLAVVWGEQPEIARIYRNCAEDIEDIEAGVGQSESLGE